MVFVKQTETGRLILQYDWGKGWGGGEITELGTEHLKTSGESLSATSQKGYLRFSFRKVKVIPFLNPLIL